MVIGVYFYERSDLYYESPYNPMSFLPSALERFFWLFSGGPSFPTLSKRPGTTASLCPSCQPSQWASCTASVRGDGSAWGQPYCNNRKNFSYHIFKSLIHLCLFIKWIYVLFPNQLFLLYFSPRIFNILRPLLCTCTGWVAVNWEFFNEHNDKKGNLSELLIQLYVYLV